MSTFTTEDGTEIFYKDWNQTSEKSTIVFSHGWPLSSDAWDAQMLFFGMQGYRVIAHDRRGHGKSSQVWEGNDMNTYADDLGQLIEYLDLSEIILVGHSTGGGEVVRYVRNWGSNRVAKIVLMSAVTPSVMESKSNPKGAPKSAFDDLRKKTVDDRAQFAIDLSMPFFGYNRPGAKASEGVRRDFWRQSMLVSIKGFYDCIAAFSETDFTEDLKMLDVPLLILHGKDDQIVPIEDSALRTHEIVKGSELVIYEGYPHGMPIIHAEEINADILEFIERE